MPMHVLSRRRLAEFWDVHPEAKGPMSQWHAAVEHATWTCFADVRMTYNSADQVREFVVFNVNSHRIIATVRYPIRKVFIAEVMTHAQYERWSKERR